MGVDRNTGKLQARDWEEPPPRQANEELLDHQRKRKVCAIVVGDQGLLSRMIRAYRIDTTRCSQESRRNGRVEEDIKVKGERGP